ncbi:MAG: 3-oxoacyl-[acyl-carrier-protein] reductase [Spirochaetales bacterium]|nr:3-oxoacyl-[acyl-carrier-protein] reductase [Spirochaetales bacterium]
MLLTGKKALVTGGSKGIGRAIVETFLKNGAEVYTLSRTPGDLAGLEEVAAQAGTQVHYHAVDVADETAITTLIKEILKESGGLDAVVNNAGITRDGLIARMPADAWNEVLRVNLASAFYICKAVSMSMLSRRGGSIINMSSVVGLHGNAGQTNYAASKAGLIGFTKSLAQELAPRGVRVNAICPGFIGTEMTEQLTEDQKKALFARIPMARMGSAEEIARVALFLASDLSTYVTGQALSVDGGMGM